MQILLRPGCAREFDYCKRLYFSGMETILRELQLDLDKQASSFQQSWDWEQVRIISLDGADVGWLQWFIEGDTLFLAQLFVDSRFQQRGIGTALMGLLISEATSAGLAMTLRVVKINPALRLYLRLGFGITHEDERKFYMRREPGIKTPASN
jgi:GNAT superfamily N-acetyltransferase